VEPVLVTEEAEQPFHRPGLASRVLPFALVSLVALVSVLLPQSGMRSWSQLAAGLLLLVLMVVAMFLLPWVRLPRWTTVLVPLVFTIAMMELTLSAGVNSGVGLVVLMPLVWSALLHRPWESGWVLVAVVAAEALISVLQSAPETTVVRRIVLWVALGCLIAVAAHGLRERIRRSHAQSDALSEQLHEINRSRDRDQIAQTLTEKVVRRLFAAGLDLSSASARVTDEQARDRLQAGVAELDEAIRELRGTVYALDAGPGPPDLPDGGL
jgi:signal transduction histidine kinase